jgi:hypothetical protein
LTISPSIEPSPSAFPAKGVSFPDLRFQFVLFILFQKRLQKELMKMVKEPPEGIIIDQGPML